MRSAEGANLLYVLKYAAIQHIIFYKQWQNDYN